MLSIRCFSAVALAASVTLIPSAGAAQAQAQCADDRGCPVGTACVAGSCEARRAPGQPAQEQPAAYSQPQPGQGQPPTYAQPAGGPPPVYAQPVYAPQSAPRGEPRTESRPMIGLAVSGGVMLGVSYLVHAALVSPLAGYSLGSGTSSSWDDFRLAGLIPLAGPWVQLALKPTPTGQDAWSPYLVIDGLLQATGATLLILGLSIRTSRTVYGRGGPDGPSFAVVPQAGRNGGGLAAVGRF